MPLLFRATSTRRPPRLACFSYTVAATEFDFEASPYPVSLYRQYFAVYLGTSAGRLPECNEFVVDEVSLERNVPCLSCRK
jgi:hypothetical protein